MERRPDAKPVSVSPKRALCFGGRPPAASLVVKNVTQSTVLFKVKTDAPERYVVRPVHGLLLPGARAEVAVEVAGRGVACADRFLVQAVALSEGGAGARELAAGRSPADAFAAAARGGERVTNTVREAAPAPSAPPAADDEALDEATEWERVMEVAFAAEEAEAAAAAAEAAAVAAGAEAWSTPYEGRRALAMPSAPPAQPPACAPAPPAPLDAVGPCELMCGQSADVLLVPCGRRRFCGACLRAHMRASGPSCPACSTRIEGLRLNADVS